MKKYIQEININLNGNKKDYEVAEALRILADDIDGGSCSGIVGWSDISWNLDFSDDEYDEESED